MLQSSTANKHVHGHGHDQVVACPAAHMQFVLLLCFAVLCSGV
jgi:hypothetical protein